MHVRGSALTQTRHGHLQAPGPLVELTDVLISDLWLIESMPEPSEDVSEVLVCYALRVYESRAPFNPIE